MKNCIQTRGVKVENLPTFDIEFLFLNIRGKSVGEEVEVNLIAPDDEETQVLHAQEDAAALLQFLTPSDKSQNDGGCHDDRQEHDHGP